MVRKSTREMIIAVAAELFATEGLRRTTMETIAVTAGRGRRTVYMYFRNKAAIYDAVVESEIREIITALNGVLHSDCPVEVVVTRYGEERYRRLAALAARNPLLIRDFALGHSRIERLRERLHRSELAILIPYFGNLAEAMDGEELLASDSIVAPTPEEYALLYLNMLRGNDKFLTKTDGLDEAIRLSHLSARLLLKFLNNHRQAEG